MDRKIAVIGLGYVGLPMAVAFGKKFSVISFDINLKRIEELKQGVDLMREIGPGQFKKASILLTLCSFGWQQPMFVGFELGER